METMWMMCAAAVLGLGGEPDGAALMRQMAAAVRDAGVLTCDAEFEGVGGLAVTIPRGQAHITMAPGDEAMRYRVDGSMLVGEAGDKASLTCASDGETLCVLKEAEKTLVKATPGKEDEVIAHEAARPLRWLWRWPVFVDGPFGAGPDATPFEATWMGRTILNGEACDIVRVDYSTRPDVEELDMYWYISTDDHLPRRIDATYFFGTGGGVGVSHISNFERASTPDPDVFAIALPDGYELKDMKAEAPVAAAGSPQASDVVGRPAPAWTLTNAKGEEVSLEDLHGSLVLMDFWATWCGPCKHAMPGVQKLHEEFGDRGLVVLGVNCWDDPKLAVQYMKDQGYTYTTLLEGDAVAGVYGVNAIPTFYVIGPDGKILRRQVGTRPGGHEALRELILENLPPE